MTHTYPGGAFLLGILLTLSSARAQNVPELPGTSPLTTEGDTSAQMVAGIGRFLDRQTEKAAADRAMYWHRDFSSEAAYEKSTQTNRERLRVIIGAVDPRQPARALEILSSTANPAVIAETDILVIKTVRWPALQGVSGEGLWLEPKGEVRARIVVLPDADQTPEMVVGMARGLVPERQFARRLAEHGCEVLVPVLVSRDDTFSGNARLNRFTNQPHREWVYRQAHEMGRHVIGYEVQKVLAAIDYFQSLPRTGNSPTQKIGVAGYAEGGLIALYAAAVDTRIAACLVSGYFDSRQALWREPIYRNLFGILREFGDAELASLIAPRALVVEYSPLPAISGPPAPREGRSGAAPGLLRNPDYSAVEAEFERATALLKPARAPMAGQWALISGTEGLATGPCSDRALAAFLSALGIPTTRLTLPGQAPVDSRTVFDPADRQNKQVRELENFTQGLLRASEQARTDFFWRKVGSSPVQEYPATTAPFTRTFHEEILGSFGPPSAPLNARARRILARPNWTGFEVVLDVYPDVFAWGYLLVPNDLKPGERRPVVVCQHGLEGVPADTINDDTNSVAFRYYKAFAPRLADRGFVVFSPHNPYRGRDNFRELQRKANPLGRSLFSIIIAQHDRILGWLATLPFVDVKRIGFYGLSYGGKTAMRVPAALDGYCLSICSGDFNDWVRKNASTDASLSYMFTGEYEMPEWNLGHTFNYAEMAALIAPRPFMVERGHNDGVGLDEWVAYEYAKVRRLYDSLDLGDRTTIEFFNGPHTINGVGTFDFLERHLGWKANR
ncbi:MAG TPA: dienelactone hydrolase family protein [Verrucomicrobiae bacterium]